MAETQIADFIGAYGFVGAVVLVLLLYRKPVLDMLSRATRDPLVESLGAQNGHFEENNRLFKAMGPVLGSMDHTLKAILKEQESQTRALHELAADSRIILDRGKR
jgi:hypothetical protein